MDPHQSPPLEIELKLGFPPEARDRIAAHPALLPPHASAPLTQHQVTTYYDTPAADLAAAGLVLRVRLAEGARIQTLKTRTVAQGPAGARGEWEWPIDQDAPDPALLANTPAAAVLAAGAALAPVLETRIRRSLCILALPDGAIVEAAIDEGHIRAGTAHAPVHELELELKAGPVAPLYRLAVELHADLPLHLGLPAKSERGLRLLTGAAPASVKHPDIRLDPGIAADHGFRQIVGSGLAALLANQPAAIAGDPEGVHQMRVALRRLRTALVLFAPHLEPHAAAHLNDALRDLGRVLGGARDWDVFCAETLPAVFAAPQQESWRALLTQRAATRQAHAHADLTAALRAATPTGLILNLAAWSHAPGLLRDAAQDAKLADLAPALLDRLARKLRRRSRPLRRGGRMSSEDLHALRKSLKKLRYAADFVAGLYPPKAVHAYLKRCRKLQELLGCINDAATATSLSEHLASETLDLVAPASAVAGWAKQRRNVPRTRLATACTALTQAPPFWQ